MNDSKRPIVVTGGSRGIGAATVTRLAALGHPVLFGYRSDEGAANALVDALVREHGLPPGRLETVRCDLATEDGVLELFAASDVVTDAHGPLAGLVVNAGIVAPASRVADMDAARIERVFALNVTGAFLCCREGVRRMSAARGGAGGTVVNVSSVAAIHGSPNEYVDYAASKAALDTLTRGLALECVDEGVRVVGVRPGIIDTDIHASGGQPDRAARIGPERADGPRGPPRRDRRGDRLAALGRGELRHRHVARRLGRSMTTYADRDVDHLVEHEGLPSVV